MPLEDTGESLAAWSEGIIGIQKLSMALEAEGELAEREGDLDQALNSFLDIVKLGVQGTRGDLPVGCLAGLSIQERGRLRIEKILDNFSSVITGRGRL